MNPFLSSVDEMSFTVDATIEMEWGNLNTLTHIALFLAKILNCACAFPQNPLKKDLNHSTTSNKTCIQCDVNRGNYFCTLL